MAYTELSDVIVNFCHKCQISSAVCWEGRYSNSRNIFKRVAMLLEIHGRLCSSFCAKDWA